MGLTKAEKIEALLSGNLQQIARATGRQSRFTPLDCSVFISNLEGKHSGGGYTDLTLEDIERRASGTVIILPDNGRHS